MRDESDALASGLREFIDQPDYPTLLLSGSDGSMALPSRMLAAFDRQDPDHLYLLCVAPCHSASAYVDGIARALGLQREALNEQLARKSRPLWPPLPLALTDARATPSDRLRAAIDYVGLHADPMPVVWVLLPGELTDHAGYQALIAPLLAPDFIEPWMDGHHFIVRDQPPALALVPQLHAQENDRVLVQEIDFSGERAFSSLASRVRDPRVPADERVMALMQLAAADRSVHQTPQALAKYGVCFNYYQERGDSTGQALCLLGAGDTLTEAKRYEEARTRYQQSLAVSVPAASLALMLQGLMGAGGTSLKLALYEDAEGYFDLASRVAGKALDVPTKCGAIEQRGVAQWSLGKQREAIEGWMAAKALATEIGLEDIVRSLLQRLSSAYRQLKRERDARMVEDERTALEDGSAS